MLVEWAMLAVERWIGHAKSVVWQPSYAYLMAKNNTHIAFPPARLFFEQGGWGLERP
jgi:hypothetical protein